MIRFRNLSDDAYVEHIRRQTRVFRKVAIGLSCLYLIGLVLFLGFIPEIFNTLSGLVPNPSTFRSGFGYGLLFGVMLGLGLVTVAWQLVNSLMMAFGPRFRIHKLLIKYYDQANNAKPKDC